MAGSVPLLVNVNTFDPEVDDTATGPKPYVMGKTVMGGGGTTQDTVTDVSPQVNSARPGSMQAVRLQVVSVSTVCSPVEYPLLATNVSTSVSDNFVSRSGSHTTLPSAFMALIIEPTVHAPSTRFCTDVGSIWSDTSHPAVTNPEVSSTHTGVPVPSPIGIEGSAKSESKTTRGGVNVLTMVQVTTSPSLKVSS